MSFWLLVLILVTLIALCWGGGWSVWHPERPYIGGLLGILGLILFIILVMTFVGNAGLSVPTR